MLKGLPLMYCGTLAQMWQLTTYHQTYPHEGKGSQVHVLEEPLVLVLTL
jgi:hypothetical protein